jgi:hypothetical protein
MTYTLELTQADLDLGFEWRWDDERGHAKGMLSQNCPVAQAFNRQEGRQCATVSGQRVTLQAGEGQPARTGTLPEPLIRVVACFDAGREPQPCVFVIELEDAPCR